MSVYICIISSLGILILPGLLESLTGQEIAYIGSCLSDSAQSEIL